MESIKFSFIKEERATGAREGGVVDAPSAKRLKWKETTKVSCLPAPQQCGCEDMSLAAIKQHAPDEFSHQLICAFGIPF